MIRFECDYIEGGHPKIIEALVKTNMEQTRGYGLDPHCEHARQLILQACGNTNAKVHFLVGGTQTNMTVIDASIRSHHGVISASSGHINVHETGAVEGTGHKILPIDTADGKLTASDVDTLCKAHFGDDEPEHTVEPGMVYISNPTEGGLVYTKSELSALSSVCHRYDLPLFMDGARLIPRAARTFRKASGRGARTSNRRPSPGWSIDRNHVERLAPGLAHRVPRGDRRPTPGEAMDMQVGRQHAIPADGKRSAPGQVPVIQAGHDGRRQQQAHEPGNAGYFHNLSVIS